MTIRYQTGAATLVQFIVMTVLNFVGGTVAAVQGCLHGDGCLVSASINILYLLLIATWYGFLAALGYLAQTRRQKWVIRLLLAAESGLAFIELYINVRHYPDILTLMMSLIDAGLAIWVAVLAFRLLRAKGSRVSPAGRGGRLPKAHR